MEHREVYLITLRYALAIAGSEFVLAARMNVRVGLLRSWFSGIEPIPDAAFLNAVDVIVAATPADIARTREVMRQSEGGPSRAAL